MSPASGWPNVMTLARKERVKLVHAHPRHIEGCDMHMWPVGHPCLGHICCVRAATTEKKFLLNIWLQTIEHCNYMGKHNRIVNFKDSDYNSL